MSQFEWNVSQEIIHFYGPFGLRWYSLFFLGGMLNGYALFSHFLKAENRSDVVKDPLLYYIMLGTILGARIGHVLFYNPGYYFSEPLRILKVWEGGLASHGGFTGVIVALYLFSRKWRDYPFLWLCDRIAILAVLAGAFIRVGNFFNSEILGKPADLPWAVIFSKIDSVPRHPTQLYEALGYASISLLLYGVYRYRQKQPEPGLLLGLALTISFLFRAFIERFKEVQVHYEKDMLLNLGQTLSLPFILIGLFLIFGFHRSQKNS